MTTLNIAAGIIVADRYCRAPKGGTTIGGKFYKGGQFCPNALPDDLAAILAPAVALKPVKLAGSSRQVAWANRLRAEKLAAVEAKMTEMLHEVGRAKGNASLAAAFRYRELAGTRQMLMVEPEAAVIIDAFRR